MFMREYSTGTYSSSAYFLSKTLIELPLALLQTVLTVRGWLFDGAAVTSSRRFPTRSAVALIVGRCGRSSQKS